MDADNRVKDFDAILERLHKEIEVNGGAVSYVVTIEKVKQCVVEEQGNWTIVADKSGESKTYGHPPSRPKIEKTKTILFSQTRDSLDITEVVKAVNGIKS